MSDLYIDTALSLVPSIRTGDFEACERVLAAYMKTLPRSPFDIAMSLEISNDPMDMAKHFDQFFLTQEQRSKIAAAYTEMNGLDINPDRWYCDLFAYDSYGGHDDHDWLCNAPSERSEEYVIKGLEPLQAVYASDALENYSFRAAAEESGYRDEGLKIPTPRHSP